MDVSIHSDEIVDKLRAELTVVTKSLAEAKATNEDQRRYISSLTRQRDYSGQLKTELADVSERLKTVINEKKELQCRYDEFIAQQQVVAAIETSNLPDSLTEEELIQLQRIHVYGICPDTAAMNKLRSLMPSSKIILVDKNESIHEDLPSNYEMYFFVTALAGHKVYNKWRSFVKRMQVPACHCNSSGLITVARQILFQYNKQVLKT